MMLGAWERPEREWEKEGEGVERLIEWLELDVENELVFPAKILSSHWTAADDSTLLSWETTSSRPLCAGSLPPSPEKSLWQPVV